ncbi:MAG: DUF4423 domain-containing protein [Halobacteriovoraceae bacterium]|jgi:uncharacterized protein (TIGR02147 family)|nr:DUF4423 domain-containing protein [Halobacteriovoraceae bacterium]
MIYNHIDYKVILKNKIKELQKKRSSLTMKLIATQLGVQSTYFSKFFNQEKTHLNDDHLFLLVKILEFCAEEIDYIFLLKAFSLSQEKIRKDFLLIKIEACRKEKKLNAKIASSERSRMDDEMSYLLNPLCLLVHFALYIDQYRNFPFRLCETLNISYQQFQEILRVLVANEMIELGEEQEIKSVKPSKIHYGKNHPLMRVHQSLLKTKINSALLKVEEKDKHSLLVTFSSDKRSFEKIKDAFQSFLKEAEEIDKKAKNEGVYQLNFDLFKWL